MNPAEARKEFIKAFGGLVGRRNAWDAWSDWLTMASSSIYNAIHKDPAVEEEYLQVAKRYDREELDTMAHLLAITVQALEIETHDFLGATFHELEVHNKNMGQFFTPFEVCRLMASIILPEPPKPGRLLRVGEPTSGSGSMVLAFHEAMMQKGAAQSRILYHLKDLDYRAWRMAYIQASLCGLAAEVELGDTLRMTTDRIWRTPAYYLHDMPTRLRVDAMLRALPGGDDYERTMEREDPKAGRRGVPESAHAPVVGEALPEVHLEAPAPAPDLDANPAPLPPDLILPRPGENFSLF